MKKSATKRSVFLVLNTCIKNKLSNVIKEDHVDKKKSALLAFTAPSLQAPIGALFQVSGLLAPVAQKLTRGPHFQ
jgi:hypothetical protein